MTTHNPNVYVMVPVEPTEAMIKAGETAPSTYGDDVAATYRAMLDAAPPAPQPSAREALESAVGEIERLHAQARRDLAGAEADGDDFTAGLHRERANAFDNAASIFRQRATTLPTTMQSAELQKKLRANEATHDLGCRKCGASGIDLSETACALPAETGEDGWITWPGGDCPVPHNSTVDLKLRNGMIKRGEFADTWKWDRAGVEKPGEILAYRPAPQRKE